MTKPECRTKPEARLGASRHRHSVFLIDSSFVLLHPELGSEHD